MAPCGHHGEHIIGNYVKCLAGCDEHSIKLKTDVRVMNPPRRGTPGHVDECACAPCRIRRRATLLVVRSKDGHDIIKTTWDGVVDSFTTKAQKSGSVRHFKFLDDSGEIVAEGRVSAYIDVRFPVDINMKFFMDKVDG